MKVADYVTAIGSTPQELDSDVARWLREGYQPFGSPYATVREDYPAFFQAMVRPHQSDRNEAPIPLFAEGSAD